MKLYLSLVCIAWTRVSSTYDTVSCGPQRREKDRRAARLNHNNAVKCLKDWISEVVLVVVILRVLEKYTAGFQYFASIGTL